MATTKPTKYDHIDTTVYQITVELEMGSVAVSPDSIIGLFEAALSQVGKYVDQQGPGPTLTFRFGDHDTAGGRTKITVCPDE